jgi:hypothetical protein
MALEGGVNFFDAANRYLGRPTPRQRKKVLLSRGTEGLQTLRWRKLIRTVGPARDGYTSADEIDRKAGWSWKQNRYPGRRVPNTSPPHYADPTCSRRVASIKSGLRTRALHCALRIIRLSLTYDRTVDAPSSLIPKTGLPNRVVGLFDPGYREVEFYAKVAAVMSTHHSPRCFEAHWDPTTKA